MGQRCQGTSQFDFSVRVYASQGAEFESERAQLGKNLREHSRCVTLIAPRSGLLQEDPDWSGIRSLPSFFSLSSHLKKGETVSETRDLSTAPGIVFLVHPDRAQVERDYHRLRQWELEGLYESALRLGGWDPRYAVVLATSARDGVAAALVDTNGDGADVERISR